MLVASPSLDQLNSILLELHKPISIYAVDAHLWKACFEAVSLSDDLVGGGGLNGSRSKRRLPS